MTEQYSKEHIWT